jgi:hypothetical protein
MPSRRELVMQAIVAVLDAPGKPEGVTVHRSRHIPIERDELPALVVYRARPPVGGRSEEVIRPDHDTQVERRLNVRIEARVTSANPEPALDPLYLWVVKALREDPTLGGLVLDLQEQGSDTDAAELGKPVGAEGIDFEATYITDENNPEEGEVGYD